MAPGASGPEKLFRLNTTVLRPKTVRAQETLIETVQVATVSDPSDFAGLKGPPVSRRQESAGNGSTNTTALPPKTV